MAGFDFLKAEKVWLAGIACVGLGIIVVQDKSRPEPPAPIVWESTEPSAFGKSPRPEAKQEEEEDAKPDILVYVSGAVKNPGIFTLPADSRQQAAIEAAGGIQPWADEEKLNPIATLRDGSKVSVARRKSKSRSRAKGSSKKTRTASRSKRKSKRARSKPRVEREGTLVAAQKPGRKGKRGKDIGPYATPFFPGATGPIYEGED
ncbi:hypothetical protein EON79_15665 [bacterium]|nr:MAG: hypothetical protein EON79_15665 [bacterium]